MFLARRLGLTRPLRTHGWLLRDNSPIHNSDDPARAGCDRSAVCGDQGGGAIATALFERIENHAFRFLIDFRRRLVRQQQNRIVGESDGKPGARGLAARQRLWRRIAVI